MLSHPLRGEGRSSIIAGQSIHNQRVERFWRDLFTGCTAIFYHLFYHLEDNELLNPDLSTHLWTLHFIYTVFINNSIRAFIDAWSNHPMRTESNRTPRQLFIQGMLRNSGSNITCVNEAFAEGEVEPSYGIDWQGMVRFIEEETVAVDPIECPVSATDLSLIQEQFSEEYILASEYLGVDRYLELLALVSRL